MIDRRVVWNISLHCWFEFKNCFTRNISYWWKKKKENLSIPLIPYNIQKYIELWTFEFLKCYYCIVIFTSISFNSVNLFKYNDYKAPFPKDQNYNIPCIIHIFFEVGFTLNLVSHLVSHRSLKSIRYPDLLYNYYSYYFYNLWKNFLRNARYIG